MKYFFDLTKKISEDNSSVLKGGEMVEDFTKPFKTKFSWYIVKLIKKYPIQSFEEIKESLTKKVEKDSRSNLIGQSDINRLFKNIRLK